MAKDLLAGVHLWIGVIVLGTISLVACSHPNGSAVRDSQTSVECLDGVKTFLGPNSEVLKCGPLNGTDAVEAVGIVKLKKLSVNSDGLPVSQLAVVRFDGGRWRSVLTASDHWIRNEAGYIGIDYIDDSYRFVGYRAALDDAGDGKTGLLLSLSFLQPNGESDGIPVQIAWNSKVGRYQEVVSYDGPYEFKPEIPQPPHRRPGR